MLKWSDCNELGILFEAFLPEHLREPQSWLLRASCNGCILAERQIRLTWPPKFGPDAGDVAALEHELDNLIGALSDESLPQNHGDYVHGDSHNFASTPWEGAALATLLDSCIDAAKSLELSDVRAGAFIGLPEGARLEEVFPVALTRARMVQMERLVSLNRLVEAHPKLRDQVESVLAALLAGDLERAGRILESAGIQPPAMTGAGATAIAERDSPPRI